MSFLSKQNKITHWASFRRVMMCPWYCGDASCRVGTEPVHHRPHWPSPSLTQIYLHRWSPLILLPKNPSQNPVLPNIFSNIYNFFSLIKTVVWFVWILKLDSVVYLLQWHHSIYKCISLMLHTKNLFFTL